MAARVDRDLKQAVREVLAEMDDVTAEETVRVLRGDTITDTGVEWANVYMDIFQKLVDDKRAGQSLGHDTTKEVAALILVQLMEKHA